MADLARIERLRKEVLAEQGAAPPGPPTSPQEDFEARVERLRAEVARETQSQYQAPIGPPQGIAIPREVRAQAKNLAPSKEQEALYYQEYLDKHAPGAKVYRDPSVQWGSRHDIYNPAGQRVGQVDPQGFWQGGIKSTAQEFEADLADLGKELGVGASGIFGGPVGAAAAELGRQQLGMATGPAGQSLDVPSIAVEGLAPGAMSAASKYAIKPTGAALRKLLSPVTRAVTKSKLATGLMQKMSVGSTNRLITPDTRDAMLEYLGATKATKEGRGLYSAKERFLKLNHHLAQNENNMDEAVKGLGNEIYAPVLNAKNQMIEARAQQRQAFEGAVTQLRQQANEISSAYQASAQQANAFTGQKADTRLLEKSQQLLEQANSLESAGPRSFVSPELAEILPTKIPLSAGDEQAWLRVRERFRQADPNGRYFGALIDKVESTMKSKNVDLDDLMAIKEELNTQYSLAQDELKKSLPTDIHKSVEATRRLFDGALAKENPQFLAHLKEYSEFKDAFPSRLTQAPGGMDEARYQPSVGSFGGVAGMAATGTVLGGMYGGIPGAVIGGTSAIALRSLSSKPSLWLHIANYAAANNYKAASAVIEDGMRLGEDLAASYWSTMAPEAFTGVMKAMPSLIAATIKNSPEFRGALINDIKADPSLSATERAQAITDINSGNLGFGEQPRDN